MPERLLRLKRPDVCRDCGIALDAGAEAWWDSSARSVTCTVCHASTEVAPIDRGEAGASAAREYERRKASREQRTRARHPIIGDALIALRSAPQHERAFARGATGERLIGTRLDEQLGDGPAIVLHDRRMPGGRGNIDHLVVAPAGVFVVDAKDIRGKVRVSTPLLGAPKLLIDGRDRTELIDGLDRQVTAIRNAIPRTFDVPVHGIVCFTQADLPLLGTQRLCGYELLYRKALVKRVTASGSIEAVAIDALARALIAAFPAA